MCKKTLRWMVLPIIVVGGISFNTQAIGEISLIKCDKCKEERKIQTDTTRKTLTYEEINKKMIEEDIKGWSPLIPGLIKLLKEEKDGEKRADVVHYLGRTRDMKILEPLCLMLLNDSVAEVRVAAAKALRWIEEYNHDTTAISTLRKGLKDKEAKVRKESAISLGELGFIEDARSVLITNKCFNVLARAGNRQSIPAIKAALNDTNNLIRIRAAQSLEYLGVDVPLFSILMEIIRGKGNIHTRGDVALPLLAERFGGDKDAINAIEKAAGDTNSYVHLGAILALERALRNGSIYALHSLRKLRDSKYEDVQNWAVMILERNSAIIGELEEQNE